MAYSRHMIWRSTKADLQAMTLIMKAERVYRATFREYIIKTFNDQLQSSERATLQNACWTKPSGPAYSRFQNHEH
jgi:hypothetical protein